MRVRKSQLVKGFLNYIENEVIPQVDDKTTQILASVAVKSVKANPAIADKFLENALVKPLLDENEDGYNIDTLFNAIGESISQYGSFTVTIPAVPLLSPSEKIFSFKQSDFDEIRRRIERSAEA